MGWDWLAGLLEGRGNFRFTGSSLNISLETNDLELCATLEELFDGTVTYRRGKKAIWNVYGDDAKHTMAIVYPLLTPKRRAEIERAFEEGGDII